MPKRIQRKRVKGWRLPENAMSVTRPGRYGNPFKIGERVEDDAVPSGYWLIDAAHCLELFENHVNAELIDDPHWLEPLRGKDLACFCKLDAPCHADILLRLANESAPPPRVEAETHGRE
jgi:hypothetical protein